jgi:putative membrane protein
LQIHLLPGGSEPDPRFTLANERTFLAWIRTSLGMLAGGIAIEAFAPGLVLPEIRKTLAVLLLVLSLVIAAGSFFRWVNVERAMRCKAPLPMPLLAPFLAVGGATAALALLIVLFTRTG